MSVWNTASGGNIRGVFPEEEDGSLTAPPAGDILNPDAVACFLRLTHDRYYAHLQEFFGSTIIAMFTDEPQIMGRHPLRPAHPKPYTPGLIDWLAERWGEDPRPWLPALWLDYGPGSADFRRRFEQRHPAAAGGGVLRRPVALVRRPRHRPYRTSGGERRAVAAALLPAPGAGHGVALRRAGPAERRSKAATAWPPRSPPAGRASRVPAASSPRCAAPTAGA